jgi:hypothetical protein
MSERLPPDALAFGDGPCIPIRHWLDRVLREDLR